jgi:hypothetical protein
MPTDNTWDIAMHEIIFFAMIKPNTSIGVIAFDDDYATHYGSTLISSFKHPLLIIINGTDGCCCSHSLVLLVFVCLR